MLIRFVVDGELEEVVLPEVELEVKLWMVA